jgi:hypothetical protein
MIKTLILLSVAFAVASPALAANLFKEQPVDQFRAAGLHKLTDEELDALQAMVERMNKGEITAVQPAEIQMACHGALTRTSR